VTLARKVLIEKFEIESRNTQVAGGKEIGDQGRDGAQDRRKIAAYQGMDQPGRRAENRTRQNAKARSAEEESPSIEGPGRPVLDISTKMGRKDDADGAIGTLSRKIHRQWK